MNYGLGIDAGGTYTDAVIVDFSAGEVLAKAKALTTRDCLSDGVAATLAQLPVEQLDRVELVSLSTTLATNAIVEGKGGKVGAILLGFDKYDTARISHAPKRCVRGRTDITGEELEPLDEDGLRAAVRELVDEQVDAVAISGMVSVKNPLQELRAKRIVAEMTDKPVVCGHEISMQLDTIKRSNTAILNARLLPILADLIAHVQRVMADAGLPVPLMVVRGDGTLMSAAMACSHPVETILSGPASSLNGARFLSGITNGLIVDIGGTTSDIALVLDGTPVMTHGGARVAEWSTNVRAVDIDTLGLGGDSAVTVKGDSLCLGPRRAIPLAYLAEQYPVVVTELRRLWTQRDSISTLIQPAEFFIGVKQPRGLRLSASEERVMSALLDGPLSRVQLAEQTGALDPSLVPVANLETLGYLQRATLTPTDVAHYQGAFTAWNREAATLGLQLFAHRAKTTPEALASFILDSFAYWLSRYLLNRLIRHPHAVTEMPIGPNDRALLDLIADHRTHLGLRLEVSYPHPVVAIGAPAALLAPAAVERLGARFVIPPHAEVANAVGAITGTQLFNVEASITSNGKSFLVHSPVERREFRRLEDAKAWASARVDALLNEQLAENALTDFTFHRALRCNDHIVDTPHGDVFLDCRVCATAIGKPELAGVMAET